MFFGQGTVDAREIRIFPVPAPAAPCAVVAGFTACDLVRAAAGFPPTIGPDAGVTPQPGDTLVLAPGIYFVIGGAAPAFPGNPSNGAGAVVIPGVTLGAGATTVFNAMPGLEIRSRDGANVTVIDGTLMVGAEPNVIIAADNVRFGGDDEDMGLTVQNAGRGFGGSANGHGILVGTPPIGNYGAVNLAAGGQGDEDIVIQNNFIYSNAGDGIIYRFGAAVVGVRAIENIRIENNIIRLNGQSTTVLATPPTSVSPFAGRNGIHFDNSVSNLGGSSEDEGIFIINNDIDSNTMNGILLRNNGSQEQLVLQHNYIVRNADNGIYWSDEVGQIENILIKENIVMQNGFGDTNGNAGAPGIQPRTFGAGIVFSNSGQIEDLYFVDNHDDDFEEGITGNGSSGVLFASAIAFITGGLPGVTGGLPGVQDIDNVMFENNVINANGAIAVTINVIRNEGPRVTGGGAVRRYTFDGVTILNAGDINDFQFKYNNIRLNVGAGVSIGLAGNEDGDGIADAAAPGDYPGFAIPGDFDANIIQGNVFWNNGTICQEIRDANGASPGALGLGTVYTSHGDGFALFSQNDINDLVFENNESKENCNNGVFLSSTGNDITGARFTNNLFNKNGIGVSGRGLAIPTADGLEISAFGDINDFIWDGGEANDNGGNGIHLDANNNTISSLAYGVGGIAAFPNTSAVAAINLADIDEILISNAQFHQNGSSAPTGSGNGILGLADKISDWQTNTVEASRNDDHGQLLSSVDDMSNISVSDSIANRNDRNRDSVGSGFFFDSTDDMDNVMVVNTIANENHVGFRYDVKGENGRDLYLRDCVANDNDEQGTLVDGSDDLSDVEVTGCTFERNNTGITLRSVDRGDNLLIDNNIIRGDDGKGVGINLQAIGVVVSNNSIRDNEVGLDADRSQDSTINNNNIARNENFGIDSQGLKPGEILDATNNWWGEPSGPDADGNPNGLGDRLSDKVDYEPWLGEPAVATDVNFQIIEFNVGDTANVGEVFLINATIRNNGTEEGSQTVNVKVDCGDFVDSNTVTRTLNPATEVEVDFNVVFPRGGECTVTIDSGNDSQTATVTVIGATGVTIESVCDANGNNRIDDDEILTCIGFWVTSEEVPGTGETISDAKIIFLVELWVTNGDVSTLPAGIH